LQRVGDRAGLGDARLAHQQPGGPYDADEGVRGLGAVGLLGAGLFGLITMLCAARIASASVSR
jgi:hypothetical protein